MREIDPKIQKCLEKGEKFVYCYELSKDETRLLFTDNCKKLLIKGEIYLPYSGMAPSNIMFNDSAHDLIEISGIFEDDGIKNSDDLSGYRIVVSLYFVESQIQYELVEYLCSKMIKQDLNFKLFLEPITAKFKQSILESYGGNCRAALGDQRCGVDKSLYAEGVSCDKKFITCCNKFNNAVNFRGEPFIPQII